LAPHKVIGDAVFVAITVTATLARRYGMMLGMVGFMTYFFALFLGAKLPMVGWLILALAIGIAVSFAMRTFVLREHPDRQLRRTLDALGARSAAVLDAVCAELAGEHHERRADRRLGAVIGRVRETLI
jgi:uncharacterized membrane protein YccC